MNTVTIESRKHSIRLKFKWEGKPYAVSLRNDTGRVLLPTEVNKKYAGRLAAEMERFMEAGTFNVLDYFPADKGVVGKTLAQHLDTWYNTLRLAPSSLKGYASAIAFWATALEGESMLGNRPLKTITLTDLRTALARRPHLSGKTVNNYVSVLRKALDLAVKEGLVEVNLANDLQNAKWVKKPVDPFTRDEADRIICYMQANYPPVVGVMVQFWFYTGMRTGEVFGLRWYSVNSDWVRVCESVVAGEQRDSTKTGVVRSVTLNSKSKSALDSILDEANPDDAVWFDPDTRSGWTDERIFRTRYWVPTLEALGIRYRRPYNMRHTFATMMLMAGRTPAWCAKQLGHSIEMFLGTYSKWLDGDQDARELAGLEAWLEKK